MEIYPENLGPELGAAVCYNRETPVRYLTVQPAPSMLGAFFLADALLTLGLWIALPNGLAVLGTFSSVFLLGWYCKQALASAEMARQQKEARAATPLRGAEMHPRYYSYSEPLILAYMNLAGSVTQAEVSDPDAQREIRAALQTLGATIFSLPIEDPKSVLDDPARLQAEAARLSSEADAEPDAVIGASLRRRAESLARRADTAAKTSLLLRRNQALRQETAEQMEALKTSLTAFRVGGQPSVPELADLAAGIQRVAREANAITEARAEVGTLLAMPGRLREDTQPIQRQSVGGQKGGQP